MRILNRFLIGSFAVLSLALTANNAGAQSFDRVVAFGDSWTDPDRGDNDGPSYAFVLADLLAMPYTEFAVDGATSAEINDQIDAYISSGVDPDALHIYWAVGNDFLAPGGTIDPAAVVTQMVINAGTGISALQQAGAQHFLIFGFIDNRLRPLVIDSGQLDETTLLSIQYNTDMEAALANRGLSDAYFNSFAFFHELVKDPVFTNISQGCEQVNCPDRTRFVWWDEIHPSITSHAMIAQGALDKLTAPTGSTPQFTSSAPTDATIGLAYTYDANATDADAGDTLTYSLTIGPAGMTIDANSGVVSFTPTSAQAGPNPVAITVDDSTGRNTTQAFVVTVAGQGNEIPSIVSSPVTTATVGTAYRYTVQANDANPGDTLTYALTTAPAGMTIDSNGGVISWTPNSSQTGSNAVTATATDSTSLSDSQSFTITVSAQSGGGGGGGQVSSGGGGGAGSGLLLLALMGIRIRRR